MEKNRQHVKAWFKEVDFNEDGMITWHELKMWGVARLGMRGDLRVIMRTHSTLAGGLQEYFNMADTNNDGTLTKQEIQQFSFWRGTGARAEEIDRLFVNANKSEDGHLKFDELRAWTLQSMGCSSFVKRMLTNATDLDQGIARLIRSADTTGDGLLTFDELVAFFRSRGVAVEDDAQFVREWMAEVDYNEDGLVDAAELKMWGVARLGVRGDIRNYLSGAATLDDGLKAYLKACDTNGDEHLTKEEILKHSLYNGTACRTTDVDKIFFDADANKNDKISFDELRGWVLKNMGARQFIKRMFTNASDLDSGIARLMAQADADKDGKLSYHELVSYLKKRGVAMETDCHFVKELIKEIEFTNDGAVDAAEIKMWGVARLGFRGDIRPYMVNQSLDDAIAAYIAAADTTGDGAVSFDEAKLYSELNGTAVPLNELEYMFNEADVNGNGKITPAELRDWCLKRMGVRSYVRRMFTNANDLDQGIARLITMADTNGDGKLTFAECVAFFKSRGVALDSDEDSACKDWFAEVEVNKDGNLTGEELKMWGVARLGFRGDIRPYLIGKSLSEGLGDFIKDADLDGDGCLTLAELQRFSTFNGTAAPSWRINAVFAEADQDMDGRLSPGELHGWVLRNMGVFTFVRRMFTNATDLDLGIARFITQADTNGDGLLTFDEIVAYLRSRGVAMEDDNKFVKLWMAEVDYQGDGVIDANELKMWGVANLGIRGDIRPFLKHHSIDDGVAAYIAAADTNGDGSLTLHETLQFSAVYGTGAPTSEITKMFVDADLDGDGKLSAAEVRAWCLKNMGVRTYVKRMFTNVSHLDIGIQRFIAQTDSSGDETVTFEELVMFLKKRGVAMEDDHKHVKEMKAEIDFYGDGGLEFDELKLWGVARLGVRGDFREYLRRASSLDAGIKAFIKAADQNGDGTLDAAELAAHSNFNGTAASAAEIEMFVKECDTNGDAKLTFEELRDWALKHMNIANFLKRMFNNSKNLKMGLDKFYDGANTNGDGFITMDEVVTYLRPRGVAIAPDCVHIKEWFEEVDQDKDGKLCREEVEAWAAKWNGFKGDLLSAGGLPDGVAAYIAAADLNGDGTLTMDEIRRYSGWKGMAVTEEQLEMLYAEADSNKDGKLTLEEITGWAEKNLA